MLKVDVNGHETLITVVEIEVGIVLDPHNGAEHFVEFVIDACPVFLRISFARGFPSKIVIIDPCRNRRFVYLVSAIKPDAAELAGISVSFFIERIEGKIFDRAGKKTNLINIRSCLLYTS